VSILQKQITVENPNIYINQLKEVVNDQFKCLRLGIIDAKNHKDKEALVKWEAAETGSTMGMVNAYKKMLDTISNDLSIDIIGKIRENFFSTCPNGTDGKKILYTPNMKSVDDLNKLPTKEEYRSFKIPNSVSSEQEDALIDHIGEIIKRCSIDCEKYDTPFVYVKSSDPECYTKYIISGASSSWAELCYIKIIEHYNNAQSIATEENTKLTNIIELVTSLERIHPYKDFNCRTFCVLILNRELIKHDFSASIMEDPNVFDYMLVEELITRIKDGQENFKLLVKEGLAHTGDALISQWLDCVKDTNNSLIKEQFQDLLEDGKLEELKKYESDTDQELSGDLDLEDDIDYINQYFAKYTLDGLSNILKLRLDDIDAQDISVLKCQFISNAHNHIEELVKNIVISDKSSYLIPVNLHNKHATGLVIEKYNNSIKIKYFDPENKQISTDLLNTLKLAFDKYYNKSVDIHFEQITVKQQKYANCGVEVVENFILYLAGKRVSQEKAIELHSKLYENALLNIESRGVHLLFEEESYQILQDNNLLHNFDYENHPPALLGQDHNDTV
jgi:hypothetical protein